MKSRSYGLITLVQESYEPNFIKIWASVKGDWIIGFSNFYLVDFRRLKFSKFLCKFLEFLEFTWFGLMPIDLRTLLLYLYISFLPRELNSLNKKCFNVLWNRSFIIKSFIFKTARFDLFFVESEYVVLVRKIYMFKYHIYHIYHKYHIHLKHSFNDVFASKSDPPFSQRSDFRKMNTVNMRSLTRSSIEGNCSKCIETYVVVKWNICWF